MCMAMNMLGSAAWFSQTVDAHESALDDHDAVGMMVFFFAQF